jgi:hypothetical protein
MKNITVISALLMGSFLMASCSDDKPVTELTKDQSIEVVFDTKSLSDTAVVLTTKKNIYLKGTMIKSIITTDTLPFPGMKTEEVEDDNGETKNVTMPKEYEFFITVK